MASPSLSHKPSARGVKGAKSAGASRKQRATRLTAALAVFVVLCTAWALMVPAISITQDRAVPEAGFYGDGSASVVNDASTGDVAGGVDAAAGSAAAGDGAAESAGVAGVAATGLGTVDSAGAAVLEGGEVAVADAVGVANPGDAGVAVVSAASAETGNATIADGAEAAAANPSSSAAATPAVPALVAGVAPGLAADDPSAMPAASFEQQLTTAAGETLAVRAQAGEGALPEGSTMQVSEVESQDVADVAKEAAEIAAGVQADSSRAVAVDIAFADAEGNPVEPEGDVHVAIAGVSIADAQDLAVVSVATDDDGWVSNAELVNSQVVEPGTASLNGVEGEAGAEAAGEGGAGETLESDAVDGAMPAPEPTVEFDTTTTTTYAIVYTVDFHYELNGKTYEFSIPGGGFVSLERMVEALGIAAPSEGAEGEAEPAEQAFEYNGDLAIEASGAGEADAYDQAVSVNSIPVSEATKQFVADIASVDFSTPGLVDVSKVDANTTVGQIKTDRSLAVQYSADLTAGQIAAINAQTVHAGDWALISTRSFTSEETLVITMSDGAVLEIAVTDAQVENFNQLTGGNSYILYVIYNDQYYALNTNGDTLLVPGNDLDALDSSYLWTYNHWWDRGDYRHSTWRNGNTFVDAYNTDKEKPIANDSFWPIIEMNPESDGGFTFSDINYYNYLTFVGSSQSLTTIVGDASYSGAASIHIYEQPVLTSYTITCSVNDTSYGRVTYGSSSTSSATDSISVETITDHHTIKAPEGNIVAIPAEGYKFSGWVVMDEGGTQYEVTAWGADSATEKSTTIRPSVTGNLTLQAVFVPDQQYQFTVMVTGAGTEMGTVSGKNASGVSVEKLSEFTSISSAVINGQASNMYELSTARKPLYKFVNWELRKSDGTVSRTYTQQTFAPGTIALTEDNMSLVAVYTRKSDTEIDTDDIDAYLQDWQNGMTGDLVDIDKTASVHDYENRIYRVDMTASSSKWDVEQSIALDFITDTSRSMYFPANLEFAKETESASTFTSLSDWLTTNATDTSQVYYVISEDSSATVFAVYYDNGWKYLDSSYFYYDENKSYTTYPRSVPNGKYLEKTGATNDGTAKTLTGKIYKSSTAPDAYKNHTGTSNGTAYWSRLDYLFKAVEVATETLYKIDPNAQVSLTTFNANSERKGTLGKTAESIYGTLSGISLSGGTRQDRGLLTSYNGINYTGSSNSATKTGAAESDYGRAFSEDSERRQTAILVSDGAPNFGNSTTLGWKDIEEQADLLKGVKDARGDNLTLMTLGLSLNFVSSEDKSNFEGLASNSEYAEHADNGAQIVAAVKELVETFVKKADLFGTATDTLDPAFYPVKSDGSPISAGYYNMDGNPLDSAPGDYTPYYQWENSDGIWTITYHNQTFEWPETDGSGNITEHGWEQVFYAKAKENFLGGNTIETNGSASVSAVDSIIQGSSEHRKLKKDGVDTPVTKTMDSPHVNVKQLKLDGNDTSWKVYVETGVTPINQIKELFNHIEVLEVVTASTNNMIADNKAMLFDPGEGGAPETFLLKDAVTVTDEHWTELTTGDGSVDVSYEKYGHSTGAIRLALTKSGAQAEYGNHNTSSNVYDEEQYVLTAQFIPYTVDEMVLKDADGGEYHTTIGSSEGTVVRNGEISENTHTIELFAKGFELTKTDEAFSNPLTGAEFMLYRPATTAEINATDEAEQNKLRTFEGTQYYPQELLVVDHDGEVLKSQLKRLGEDSVYFIEETKAPDGYNLLTQPIKVELVISNAYTPKPTSEEQNPSAQTTEPSSGLYDLEQKAKLMLTAESGLMRAAAIYDPADPNTDLTHVPIEENSDNEIMYYRIANNPGVELPVTGGPGTEALAIPGALLTLLGAALLLRNRKRA